MLRSLDGTSPKRLFSLCCIFVNAGVEGGVVHPHILWVRAEVNAANERNPATALLPGMDVFGPVGLVYLPNPDAHSLSISCEPVILFGEASHSCQLIDDGEKAGSLRTVAGEPWYGPVTA
jgi:hypothetical protein